MSIHGIERIWLYLHDDQRVVPTTEYVHNTYRYLNRLLDFLYRNPECIPELKYRMTIERLNDSSLFLKMRNGYGKTEYRLIKLMNIRGLGANLKRYFPELVNEEVTNKLSL